MSIAAFTNLGFNMGNLQVVHYPTPPNWNSSSDSDRIAKDNSLTDCSSKPRVVNLDSGICAEHTIKITEIDQVRENK